MSITALDQQALRSALLALLQFERQFPRLLQVSVRQLYGSQTQPMAIIESRCFALVKSRQNTDGHTASSSCV